MEYCADIVKTGDPDRHAATMLARPDARGALFALYAFNLEIARAPWASAEEIVAMMRLQWWVDAVEDLANGTVRDHPVLPPLAAAVEKYGLPVEKLAEMAEARRFDVYRDGHADRAAFDAYINTTSGNLMQLAALTLGAPAQSLPVIADYAYAAGIANLLRALPTLYARGRHPVPVACALDRNAVASGKVPENLAQSLADITADALARLQAAHKKRGLVPKSLLPALLAVPQVTMVLHKVNAAPEEALEMPLATSEFRKNAGQVWRAVTGLW